MASTIIRRCSNAWFEHYITESGFNVVDKHTTGLAVSGSHFLGMAARWTANTVLSQACCMSGWAECSSGSYIILILFVFFIISNGLSTFAWLVSIKGN